MGARDYQRFLLSKPVVGHNIIALHAVPAYGASTYLVSAFPAHSTSISPKFSNPQRCNVYLNSESEFVLVVGIHFVSP